MAEGCAELKWIQDDWQHYAQVVENVVDKHLGDMDANPEHVARRVVAHLKAEGYDDWAGHVAADAMGHDEDCREEWRWRSGCDVCCESNGLWPCILANDIVAALADDLGIEMKR